MTDRPTDARVMWGELRSTVNMRPFDRCAAERLAGLLDVIEDDELKRQAEGYIFSELSCASRRALKEFCRAYGREALELGIPSKGWYVHHGALPHEVAVAHNGVVLDGVRSVDYHVHADGEVRMVVTILADFVRFNVDETHVDVITEESWTDRPTDD